MNTLKAAVIRGINNMNPESTHTAAELARLIVPEVEKFILTKLDYCAHVHPTVRFYLHDLVRELIPSLDQKPRKEGESSCRMN